MYLCNKAKVRNYQSVTLQTHTRIALVPNKTGTNADSAAGIELTLLASQSDTCPLAKVIVSYAETAKETEGR